MALFWVSFAAAVIGAIIGLGGLVVNQDAAVIAGVVLLITSLVIFSFVP